MRATAFEVSRKPFAVVTKGSDWDHGPRKPWTKWRTHLGSTKQDGKTPERNEQVGGCQAEVGGHDAPVPSVPK